MIRATRVRATRFVGLLACAGHVKDSDRLGYAEWHLKAEETHKKGARQHQCSECSRWYFPWEMT